jgi:hypothetical protein
MTIHVLAMAEIASYGVVAGADGAAEGVAQVLRREIQGGRRGRR